jgi:hypothetical protein
MKKIGAAPAYKISANLGVVATFNGLPVLKKA